MRQCEGSEFLSFCFIAFLFGADMAISNNNKLQQFSLSWETILDEYSEALQATGRSEKTIDGYRESLIDYFTFLETHGLMNPVDRLGLKELTSYLIHLQKRDRWPNNPHIREENRGRLSPFTIRARARDIKTHWSWMRKNGYIVDNYLAGFTLPKVPDKLVEIIRPEQFKIILSDIETTTPEGLRHYCIMLIFYDNGMRLSELRTICIRDINLQSKTIKVFGKGQRERLVPITVYTRKYIMKYINGSRPRLCPDNCPYLFADSDGEPMTKNSIQQFMRRLIEKTGKQGLKLTPLILRHSFATLFLANGGSITDLQVILGHKSITTTQKYAKLQVQDIQKRHAMFSPVAQLFRNKL